MKKVVFLILFGLLTCPYNLRAVVVLDGSDLADLSGYVAQSGVNVDFYQVASGEKVDSIPEAHSFIDTFGQFGNPIFNKSSFISNDLMDFKNTPNGGIGFFRVDNPFPYEEHFIDLFSGLIFIDQPKEVTFFTYAVDGYQLKIADQILMQDWITSSTTPPQLASVQFLSGGYYPIEITNFENGTNQQSGSAGLEVAWINGLLSELPQFDSNGRVFQVADHFSLLGPNELYHAQAIPEPSTFSFLVLGLLFLAIKNLSNRSLACSRS